MEFSLGFKAIRASQKLECDLVRALRNFANTLKLQKEWRGKIEVNPPKFSCLVKVDPSQDQKRPSCPEEIEGQKEKVSSSK